MWFVFLAFFFIPTIVLADHGTPERVVDQKYTVIVLPNSSGDALHFFFRDSKTGKNITDNILYKFSIEGISTGNIYETNNGTGVINYVFPHGGLYELDLEFTLLGKVYTPEHWSLWIRGIPESFADRYPIGYAEISGIITLVGATLIFLISIFINRKRKPYEIDILKFFKL